MPIGPLTIIGIYLIVWWTILFAVLPLGSSSERHEPPSDGSQWGAPEKPNLKKKFITTTWVAAIVWAVVMVIIYFGWMPLPDFSRAPAI